MTAKPIDGLYYTSRDVTVDFRIDRASVKGDRGDVDRLAFVDRVLTGRGDDCLFGDSGPNSFLAGGGDERVFTGPGDDSRAGWQPSQYFDGT